MVGGMKMGIPMITRVIRHASVVKGLGLVLLLSGCATTPPQQSSMTDGPPPIAASALQAAEQAPEVQQAMALKDQVGHKKEAAALFKLAADRGNPVAQAELGRMHMAGLGAGADLDPAAAVALFGRSADQGYAPGEVGLGRAYRTGTGVAEDRAMAVHWYALAAAQDEPTAQALYGLALFTGDHVRQDKERGRAPIDAAYHEHDVAGFLIESALHNPDGPPTAVQLDNLSRFVAQ